MKRTHPDSIIWLAITAIIFFMGLYFVPSFVFPGGRTKAEALCEEVSVQYSDILNKTPEGWDQAPTAFKTLQKGAKMPFGFWVSGTPKNVRIQCLDGAWASFQPGNTYATTSGTGWLALVIQVLEALLILLGAGIISKGIILIIPRWFIEENF